ncbi:MAG: hypothetical protein U9P71_09210 [Campylobacterota bacterium]|nr:hypothetical protein [Campylobacterota bacterium]
MNDQNSLKQIRKKVELRLREWIPNSNALVAKELSIFDHITDRRDFLKTTSLAATMAIIGHGCGNDGAIDTPPSTWIEFEDKPSLVGVSDEASVSRASKITVDSDIVDGVQQYHALPAVGSEDAVGLLDDAILESFNPHIMTAESEQTLLQSGLKSLKRNYGIPEIVQLFQEGSSDYYLNIYEESRNGHPGLVGQKIVLSDTASFEFTQLLTANGNYHNKVFNKKAYSQKMILLANTAGVRNQTLKLYYQVGSSDLLEAGTPIVESTQWQSLDIIKYFRDSESAFSFENFTLLDIGSYEDGSNHNFLYGTIQFDDFYNYGFVATFSSITDSEPTLTFFTPKFLSHQGSAIEKLKDSFESAFQNSNIEPMDGDLLSDFSLFAFQKFIPFVQVVNSDGVTSSHILFSFVGFDTSSDGYYQGEVDVDGDEVDISHFCTTSSSITKRYLIAVDSAQGGVNYLMQSYDTTPSIELDDDYFTLHFDTSDIPTIDIWQKIHDPDGKDYSKATVRLKNSYIRSIETSGSGMEIIQASSYFDGKSLGVIHHGFTLTHESMENFELLGSDIYSHICKTEETFDEEGDSYNSLWFDEMVGSSNSYNTLAQCINSDNGYYDFYCTHNRQGLLRSYFIVNINNSSTKEYSHNFLLNYNEQGSLNSDESYVSQTHEALFNQIKNENILKHPPLPITTNAKKLHRWCSVGQDEEIIFTKIRTFETDENTKELKANSGEREIYSYSHATVDHLEGSWITQEHTRRIPEDVAAKEYTYKTTKHHVHLHVNNIYDHPVALEENRYIELRFTKRVKVSDLTNLDNISTYNIDRFSSLFLKPDEAGKINLHINSGVFNSDMMKGVTMMYRFLDPADLSVSRDQPVALVTGSSSETSEFKQCNISFRQFERLSTSNINTAQPGALESNPTVGKILRDNVKDGAEDTVVKITDVYARLHTNTKPDNDSALQRTRAVTASSIINPITFSMRISSDERKVVRSISVSHWANKAKDTIANVTNSVQGLEKDVVDSIKKAVEDLAEDIDKIASEIDIPLSSIINKLKIILETVLKIEMFNYYLSWLALKAIFDFNGAWDIGSQMKKLFHDQLSAKSSLSYTAYDIIKDQTDQVKHNIEKFTADIKDNIHDHIDESMGVYSCNHYNKKQKISKSRQRNSTKSHNLDDQTKFLFSSFGVGTTGSSTNLECSDGDTVEELVTCIINNEKKVASDGIQAIINDNMNLFDDLVLGSSKQELRSDLAQVQKDCVDWTLDQMAVTAEGVVQVPLAFLNGSTLLESAYREANGALKDVFEFIGVILFQDKDRFQTIDDFGYFYTGELLNFTLIFSEDIIKIMGVNKDLRAYIRDGGFRNDINSLSSSKRSKDTLEVVVLIAEVYDSIIELIHLSMDYYKLVEGNNPFKVFGRMIILARVIFRIPMVFSHTTNKDPNIQVWGTATDIFFMATMIINFAKKGYSWTKPWEEEAREGWGLAYTSVNTLTCVFSLTVSIIKDNKDDAGAIETLETIVSSIFLLQAFIKFYVEMTPEPDPRVVTVNLLLSTFRMVEQIGMLSLEIKDD